jgi:hypothetical protein
LHFPFFHKNGCPILDASSRGDYRNKGGTAEFTAIDVLSRLLVEAIVVVMMMVTMMDHHHDLRLRRVGHREAEDQSHAKQNLFHALS